MVDYMFMVLYCNKFGPNINIFTNGPCHLGNLYLYNMLGLRILSVICKYKNSLEYVENLSAILVTIAN